MRVVMGLTLVCAIATSAFAEPAMKTERRRSHVHAAWTFACLGGGALVTATVLGFVAKHRYDAAFDSGLCDDTVRGRYCNPEGLHQTSKARTLGLVGTGFGLAGLGLWATSAIVYAAAPRDTIAIAPAAGTSSAGVVVVGRF